MIGTSDVDELVDALVRAFVVMTAAEQALVVTIYRLLAEGATAHRSGIASASGWPADEVDSRLRSWPGVFFDGDGAVVGLWGMTVEAVSPHQLGLAGHDPVWMWCALDPLFIVPLLGDDGEVSSICPTTGEAIHVRIGAEGALAVEPASTVVSFVMPDGPFDADIRQSFCHFVYFLASPTAADQWVAGHPGTFWVPVAEAAQVGRRLAARVFPAIGRAG
jgi:alkylmercury lyase